MIRTFASAMMSLCLVAHAMLGCCWHHDDNCCEERVASSVAVCHDECCEHEHDSDQHSGPCDCQAECCQTCVYLPLEKTVVERAALAIDLVAIVDAGAAVACSQSAAWQVVRDVGPPVGPVRRHLMLAVLVI